MEKKKKKKRICYKFMFTQYKQEIISVIIHVDLTITKVISV